jgi:hypothetical protein
MSNLDKFIKSYKFSKKFGFNKETLCVDGFMGAIIIKQVKKDVKWALKIVKIGKLFMFYHLKPWKS